ncbi:hypothetical protein Acr_12g0005940 [Actinidia rufa]|uniref:Uncharacterized protein n=1 Tax=Actinidia rufa TaxID=165716 RepID=A0A7J0FHJ4_9ERIC|nr:hypothetical protein Acr_12g0005940 [Actinidia rufa]
MQSLAVAVAVSAGIASLRLRLRSYNSKPSLPSPTAFPDDDDGGGGGSDVGVVGGGIYSVGSLTVQDVLCRQCSWFGPDCNQIKGGSSKVGKLFVLSAKVGIGQSFKGLSENQSFASSIEPFQTSRVYEIRSQDVLLEQANKQGPLPGNF